MQNSGKNKNVIFLIACIILLIAAVAAVGFLLWQRKQLSDMSRKYKRLTQELEEMYDAEFSDDIREETSETQEIPDETEPIAIEPAETEPMETEPIETAPVYLESLSGLPAGSILSEEQLDFDNLDSYFMAWEIEEGDNLYERINGKSYKKNDYVPLSSLRYIKMPHYNFDGQIQVGEMIVSADIMEDVFYIFKELLKEKYQIQSMYLVDNYWTGDPDTTDSASIDVNNTSAFCFRMATGSGHLSNHAYGKAIDLNPQQNPYVSYSTGQPKWAHSNADDYIDRATGLPHVITHEDLAFKLFTERGFRWGGDWNNPKDYQHFDKNEKS